MTAASTEGSVLMTAAATMRMTVYHALPITGSPVASMSPSNSILNPVAQIVLGMIYVEGIGEFGSLDWSKDAELVNRTLLSAQGSRRLSTPDLRSVIVGLVQDLASKLPGRKIVTICQDLYLECVPVNEDRGKGEG